MQGFKSLACFFLAYFSCIVTVTAQQNKALVIESIQPNFYAYTTYNTYEGNQIPAHGMYLITPSGVVLFDTPWDTTQFQALLDTIKQKHQLPVTHCIATHWHSDRTAGLAYYQSLGIKTYTTLLTDSLSKHNNAKRAEYLIKNDTVFQFQNTKFEVYYPGPGHTIDNIVVWFPSEKILYGGCLIKGADATNLGYMGDADSKNYYNTLLQVKKRFKKPTTIIVSHHNWKNNRSLKNSIKLAKKLQHTI
jgi:metallo-beta-lactamase class B